jgi:hypothetical protein
MQQFREVSGHVFRVERKREGWVWYAKYRLPDGRQVQRKIGRAWCERGRPAAGFFTRRTAEAWLRDVQDQARAGTLPGMVRTNATVADACLEWLRCSSSRPTTSRRVPFGRNRMLKLAGGALFGAVSGSIPKANPAWASHQGPPGPCFEYQKCHSCVGSTCNLVTCGYYGWLGCPSGGQCWQACYSNCTWNCCDWQFTSGSTWQTCLCGVCISGTSC